MKKMHANTTTKSLEREPRSCRGVRRAIDWLQTYIDNEPYTEAASEARSIICDLKAVRQRSGLDELLALIAQIAQTDEGMQQIDRAKLQLSQLEQVTATDKTTSEM